MYLFNRYVGLGLVGLFIMVSSVAVQAAGSDQTWLDQGKSIMVAGKFKDKVKKLHKEATRPLKQIHRETFDKPTVESGKRVGVLKRERRRAPTSQPQQRKCVEGVCN